jgi:hypothetical protein
MRNIPSIVAVRRGNGRAHPAWSGDDRRDLLRAIERAVGRRPSPRRAAMPAMR